MKTPMQGHLIYLRSLKEELEKKDFTPLTRSGLNEALDAAIDHAESMLDKEKERMCGFAEYTRKCGFLSDQRGLMTTEELYDQTFKTKER
jgi:hypothetical protein